MLLKGERLTSINPLYVTSFVKAPTYMLILVDDVSRNFAIDNSLEEVFADRGAGNGCSLGLGLLVGHGELKKDA